MYFYSGCMAKLYSQVTLNLLQKAFAFGTVTLKRHVFSGKTCHLFISS